MAFQAYYFSEEHELFRSGLRSFLDKEVHPFIDQWEEERQIPKALWKKFGDQGYLGLNYAEQWGGSEGDFFFSVVFLEEIAKCFSGGFTITPTVQQYMASPYISKHGSDFLKEKYLRKAINGESICAIAISEPGAGSDVANIQTKAIRNGDHYIVNGAKTFITNAYYGDFLIAVVKTEPEKGIDGTSLLVIDRAATGVSASKLKKLGWHASDTAELHFDEVKVPVENLIGEEGKGFYYLMGGLQLERLAGAICAVSACEHMLEYTLQYMSEREAFGRPINKFQVLRHRMAQLASEITSTKAFVYQCARMHADKIYAVKECSMAKLLATELSDKVATQCLQSFGGYGYMEEFKIARMFRDSRIGTIGGGTSEIMREIIAKMMIDDKNYHAASTPVLQSSENEDPFITIFHILEEKGAKAKPLGNKLNFNFSGQTIHVDGTGTKNRVLQQNQEADCTIAVSTQDFMDILKGKLNPMNAMMGGKIQIEGDLSVAMKLQSLLN